MLNELIFGLRRRYPTINRAYKKMSGISKETKDFVDLLYKYDHEGNFDLIIRNHWKAIPEKIQPIAAKADFLIHNGCESLEKVIDFLLFELDEKYFKPYSRYAIDKRNGSINNTLSIEINGYIFRPLNSDLTFENVVENINKGGKVILIDNHRNIQKSICEC